MLKALHRLRNQIVYTIKIPHVALAWVFLFLLLILVVQPIIEIAVGSLTVGPRDARQLSQGVGTFTPFYWDRALISSLNYRLFFQPLGNTLTVSFLSTIMAMIMGLGLAWLRIRTDMPLKGIIGTLAFVPYILPSWAIALAWLGVFRHDDIWLRAPGVLQYFTGLTVPNWFVFGPVPISIILALNYFAFTYLLASASLATIDSALEESAEINGANSSIVLRRITLPLILPSLASAFILTLIIGVANFGVPHFLGSPANYYTLPTMMYSRIRTGRMGDAFVIGIVMILLASLVLFLNSRVVGTKRQYTTLSGKGGRRSKTSLGQWRYPVASAVLVFLFFAGVFPVLMLGLESLQFLAGSYSLDNMSLAFWTGRGMMGQEDGVLVSPRVLAAARNTIVIGLSVGTISVVSSLLLGYSIAKGRGSWLSRIVEQLSFLPFVIPGVVLGAIYLTMWANPPLFLPSLYGTLAVIVLALAVFRMPYAARSGISAMMQIGAELEEAATLHGCSFGQKLRRVLIPLTRQGLLVGFLLNFIGAAKDLTIVIMLSTTRTQTLSVVAESLTEYGEVQFGYAIALIIVAIVLVGTVLATKISKSDPVEVFKGAGG